MTVTSITLSKCSAFSKQNDRLKYCIFHFFPAMLCRNQNSICMFSTHCFSKWTMDSIAFWELRREIIIRLCDAKLLAHEHYQQQHGMPISLPNQCPSFSSCPARHKTSNNQMQLNEIKLDESKFTVGLYFHTITLLLQLVAQSRII